MPSTTISLARVMDLNVPVAWQEAVEVVHALDLASAAEGTVITPEGALISVDGTVALSPPGPGRGIWVSPLRLLGRLLDGVSAPPELQELIGSDADALSSFMSEGDSNPSSVRTIDWFTRPNGASLIGGLAARAIAALGDATESAPPAHVDEPAPTEPATPLASWPVAGFAPPSQAFVAKPRQSEWSPPEDTPAVIEALPQEALAAVPAVATIQHLRERVRELPAAVERAPVVRWLRENFRRGRIGIVEAALAATFLMVVSAWAWLPSRPELPAIAARGPVLIGSAVISFATPVLSVSPFASSLSARAMAPAAPSDAAQARPERGISFLMPSRVSLAPAPGTPSDFALNAYQATGMSSTPTNIEFAPAAASPSVTPVARGPASSPATGSSVPATRPTTTAPPVRAAGPVDRRIYSAADAGVEPPSMLRLQMPAERRADSEIGDSWVEVVVDERGQVAQVRLQSSKPSLNDRMIVSAAKAWQFQPALKDGTPVKYVLRLPVTR